MLNFNRQQLQDFHLLFFLSPEMKHSITIGNYKSPKKIGIVIFSLSMAGLSLIGQNCSVKQNLSINDNEDSSSSVNEQNDIDSRANSANSANLIISSNALNGDDVSNVRSCQQWI